jgi:hypothetical protein
MGIFKRKKRKSEAASEDEEQRFSHSSGAQQLGDVLAQHDPKYDKANPPPVPRGRSKRLRPDADE